MNCRVSRSGQIFFRHFMKRSIGAFLGALSVLIFLGAGAIWILSYVWEIEYQRSNKVVDAKGRTDCATDIQLLKGSLYISRGWERFDEPWLGAYGSVKSVWSKMDAQRALRLMYYTPFLGFGWTHR